MARSLSKLREYEKQVEAIPVMQVKLSVLKEEKRLLMLQLKQRELQMRRNNGGGDLGGNDLGNDLQDLEDYDTEDEDGVRFEEREKYFESTREAIQQTF